MISPPLSGLSFGSIGVFIIVGPGLPGSGTNDDAHSSILNAGVGSLFLRTDDPGASSVLYVKTGTPNVWTAK